MHGEHKANFQHQSYSHAEHFPCCLFSVVGNIHCMALPKLGRANIFYFLIFSLFHLLQTALCLSITRLHCSLISFLWPFASLFLCFWPQESRTGLLISWPAVLLVHTCSFSLPGRRTGLYFCFSAADRRQDVAAHGRAAELWCSECVSGYCWSALPKAALPPALFSVSRDSSPPCLAYRLYKGRRN